MELEEAENIIDTMYREKMKKREFKMDDTLFIDVSKSITFNELETASIILLRAESRFKRELTEKKEIINKAREYIETCRTSLGNYVLSPNETEYLLELLDKEN